MHNELELKLITHKDFKTHHTKMDPEVLVEKEVKIKRQQCCWKYNTASTLLTPQIEELLPPSVIEKLNFRISLKKCI